MHSKVFYFQVLSRKCVYLTVFTLIPHPWSVFTLLQIFMSMCEPSVPQLSKSLRCRIQSNPFGRFQKILCKECQSWGSAEWKTALKESVHRAHVRLYTCSTDLYRYFPFLLFPPNGHAHTIYQSSLWMTYGSFQKSLHLLPSSGSHPHATPKDEDLARNGIHKL